MTDLSSALASRIHDMAWVAWGSYIGADMSHCVDLEREREGAHHERISPSKPPVGWKLRVVHMPMSHARCVVLLGPGYRMYRDTYSHDVFFMHDAMSTTSYWPPPTRGTLDHLC